MLLKLYVSGQTPPRTDRHRLAGIVTVDGLPAKRLVAVIDRVTLVMVATKWSDPYTGAWEIKGLPQYPERRLLVVALDVTGSYNAPAADYISQVTA